MGTVISEVKARKWRAQYPGIKFGLEYEYDEPMGVEKVIADVEAWHKARQGWILPEGMKYIPLDNGKPKRYILEFHIVEVDDNGEEVDEKNSYDFTSVLTATTDAEALQQYMQELYQDATEYIESLPNETLSDLYPSDSPRFPVPDEDE